MSLKLVKISSWLKSCWEKGGGIKPYACAQKYPTHETMLELYYFFLCKRIGCFFLHVQVQEGEMKELDLSVINAVDMDVPPDPLVFEVVQRPLYGLLINGVQGSDILHYRDLINRDHHSHGLLVHDFSMELLRNGRCSILLTLVFHSFNEASGTLKTSSSFIYSFALFLFSRQCLQMEVVLFNAILLY